MSKQPQTIANSFDDKKQVQEDKLEQKWKDARSDKESKPDKCRNGK